MIYQNVESLEWWSGSQIRASLELTIKGELVFIFIERFQNFEMIKISYSWFIWKF